MQLKQKQSKIPKLMRSSIGALVITLFVYLVLNISLVVEAVNFKKMKVSNDKLATQISDKEAEIIASKRNISLENASALGLSKLESNNYIVRKDTVSNLSVLYVSN
jgi:ribosomal protein L24